MNRIVLSAFLALCLVLTARAGNPTPKPRVHHHTVIEAVSADSITIDSAAGEKTYKITKDTEITFKGDTVTAGQLQVGMRVSVDPDSTDETVAATIQANDPPKDPAPSPAK